MNQYPIILIPDLVIQAMNAVPLALTFTEPKPLPPSYKPLPIDVLSFFIKLFHHYFFCKYFFDC